MSKDAASELPEKDFVANDKLWRGRVKNETEAARVWDATWGFLKDDFGNIAKHGIRVKKPVQRPVIVEIEPSPKPIPKTTSKQIGWRSSVPALSLERYGAYNPKPSSILRQLGWPPEACP